MQGMPHPTPPPRRRFWRRLLKGVLVAALVVPVLLVGTAWWAHEHRLELTNRALASLQGPVTGKVEGIKLTRSGEFEVLGLTLKDKTTGGTVLKLPKVTGTLSWDVWRTRAIRGLTFYEPEISLDEQTLVSWLQPPLPKEAPRPASPSSAAFRLENLNLQDARLSFTRNNGQRIEVMLNYRSDYLSMDGTGTLSTGKEELTISQMGADADQKTLPYGLRQLHAKGRMDDGWLDLEELTFDGPTVRLTPDLLGLFGMVASGDAKAQSPSAGPVPSAAPSSVPEATASSVLRGIRVNQLVVTGFHISATDFDQPNATGMRFPDLQLHIPRYEAGSFEWTPGGKLKIASQTLQWEDIRIWAPANDGHFHCPEMLIRLGPWELGGPTTIERLNLRNPDIHWTPALRRLLTLTRETPGGTVATGPGQESPANPPSAPPSTSPPSHSPQGVTITKATLTGAEVKIEDEVVMPFNLETKGSMLMADLTFDEEGWHSKNFQNLEITETRLTFPSAPTEPPKKPWLELAHGELVINPDDWAATRRVSKLNFDKLVVRMRDGNTPWIATAPPLHNSEDDVADFEPVVQPEASDPKPQTPIVAASPVKEEEPEEWPWWKRLNFGQIFVREGLVDLLLLEPKPVDLRTRIDISTRRLDKGGSEHTVKLTGCSVKLPTLSPTPFPVMQAQSLEGVVQLPEVWQTHHFEKLHLTGGSIDMSEALMKLFEPDQPEATASAPEVPTPKTDELVLSGKLPAPSVPSNKPVGPANAPSVPPPAPKPSSPWHVGHLIVEESDITVTNLVPGMPSVKFGVSFNVVNTPLLPEDLAENVQPQRIELHNLKIPSPNGTARYVAELDSIFVSFTLGGLMQKEIEGIEIVSPTLFVGEDLFWYVDFYRKYAERGAVPAKAGPQIAAANSDDLEFELASAIAEAEPEISQASWSVKRLQVHSGKLVLAPKGIPLKGFRTPFPFHIDSEVRRGTLEADMEIPPDTYALPDFDLQFQGMHGKVQFNLPFKQKDNNLTETFEVESIRYKSLKTGKAFLSVTYDTAGFYAKFGAEAYDGYLNGELNVYNDDSYHWDGWIGGKNIQTHEITRILCPGYFLMDGRVEATLVAQGSKNELYQADGSFSNHTPGKITISALNGIIKDLPKDWDPLKAQITKIGLETLRDFAYDHAEMKCRFYGREGNGFFRFSGPLGTRKFDINVYDHRWKADETKVGELE